MLAIPASADEAFDDAPETPVVTVMRINSAIGPITVREIKNGLERSEDLDAEAFVIELNTPGGNMESTWDIIQVILASEIPVVIYVSPPGARAASAGVYISYAAHVAAMAPQTNIGSAHPVSMGAPMDSTMAEKVTNDAVAKIKTLGQKRGRNIEWAEEAVRQSVSVTEFEALELNVIDFLADDLDDLLYQMDGATVEIITGDFVLDTEGAEKVPLNVGFANQILEILSDPNVAYILMTIGLLGLYFEFSNPGAILPGVIGGIALILALFSFQALPINFAGVLLILLALVLFLLEVKITSHGILGGGGVISLFLGSLMLVNDAEWPYKSISLSVIIPVVVVFTLFFFLAAWLSIRAHKRKVETGQAGIVGEIGVAKSVIGPDGGSVFINGEYWKAVSEVQIEPNNKIKVVDVKGMELRVEKL
ncbi:MAG: nodulation protein NfeD [Candidatus Zixiibacteriota bacterium]|nr:MAG: nodulation protein NfeD [candidate division Zixibacteria bacterium]